MLPPSVAPGATGSGFGTAVNADERWRRLREEQERTRNAPSGHGWGQGHVLGR